MADDKNNSPIPEEAKSNEPEQKEPEQNTQEQDIQEQETPSTPFKTFLSKKEFDDHSAGIMRSAQKKAEKELLALLGLKPDEKDKLKSFKTAYENTLSEADRIKKAQDALKAENEQLKRQVLEEQETLLALDKLKEKTSASTIEVKKLVHMAKGLVDDNTTFEEALNQVLDMVKLNEKSTKKPTSTKPLASGNSQTAASTNPFKTKDVKAQVKLIRADRDKAEKLWKEAYPDKPFMW